MRYSHGCHPLRKRRGATHAVICAAACAALASQWPARASSAPGTVSRFALVIGSNHAEKGQAPLRYADDDAVATYQLLQQAHVQTLLLVTLDDHTRALHPQLRSWGGANWKALDAAMHTLEPRMRTAQRFGSRSEFMLFYSGHGDVDRGEGYVQLDDGRLTRSALYRRILSRSPATYNHVIIDACKSYYLAFSRGAGGERARLPRGFAARSQTVSKNTGFILSTSSDRESHEWEHFRAGVFSHMVRSALRGGADANRDRAISYAEIGAFLTNATTAIHNPYFHPDFVVMPPGTASRALDVKLIEWRPSAHVLLLDRSDVGHVYVEAADGARVVDAHPARGQQLLLHLPHPRPMFVRRSDQRGEFLLAAAGSARLSQLRRTPLQIASRGAVHLAFTQLFALPFSQATVRAYRDRYQRDLSRLRPLMETPRVSTATPAAQLEQTTRDSTGIDRGLLGRISGWSAVTMGAVAGALGIWSLAEHQSGLDASQADRDQLNRRIGAINTTAIVVSAAAGAAAIAWLVNKLWPSSRSAPNARRSKPLRPLDRRRPSTNHETVSFILTETRAVRRSFHP